MSGGSNLGKKRIPTATASSTAAKTQATARVTAGHGDASSGP
jgi:hypothetical protein